MEDMSDICDSQRSISYVLGSVMPVARSVKAPKREAERVNRHVPQIFVWHSGINISEEVTLGETRFP